MANTLEKGATFEEAVAAVGPRMPAHVRAVFTAGAKTGHLASALEDLVDLDRSRLEFRRRIHLAVAYPVFLLIALVCLLAFLGGVVLLPFQEMFAEFQLELPAMTQAVLVFAGSPTFVVIVVLCALVLLLWVLWMLPGPALLRRIQRAVPFVGPLRHWGGMVCFTQLMSILLDCRVSLPDALRIAASAARDRDVSLGGRRAAAWVEGGGSLVDGLETAGAFPPTLMPLVGWGQKNGTLQEAFRTASDVFRGRAESHVWFLGVMLLPCVFLIIIITIPLIIMALLLPLVDLISSLA
jgi:type II secretory pathway component PulF